MVPKACIYSYTEMFLTTVMLNLDIGKAAAGFFFLHI